MIDAFGYKAMPLREVQEKLKELTDRLPQLLDQPVWIGGLAPIYVPVNGVLRAQHGAMLTVVIS